MNEPKPKFKLQTENNTVGVQLRIRVIDNGFLIQAGAAPYYCRTVAELRLAVENVMDEFLEEIRASLPDDE